MGRSNVVLSCSGLGPRFLALLSTKYWKLFFLHWYFPIWELVYSLSIRGPSTKSPTLSYNMSNKHYSVMVPEHSSQSLLPGLTQPILQLGMPLAEVPVNCSPRWGDECECKSDLDTEFFCRCYAVQPWDFSLCRIRVTLHTVFYCRCYASICWNACKVAGLAGGGISGNTAELPLW